MGRTVADARPTALAAGACCERYRAGRDSPGREKPGARAPGRESPGRESPGRESPGREKPGARAPAREGAGALALDRASRYGDGIPLAGALGWDAVSVVIAPVGVSSVTYTGVVGTSSPFLITPM